MIEQLSFPARTTDPSTSHEAARKPRTPLRMKVLAAYVHGPLTDEEAGTWSGVKGAWKRCSELRALGLIEPCGRTYVTSTHAHARLCKITEAGRVALRPTNERNHQ